MEPSRSYPENIQLQVAFLVPVVRTCYDHCAEKFKIGELFYFHSHQNAEIRKTCYFYRHTAQGNKHMSPIQGDDINTWKGNCDF